MRPCTAPKLTLLVALLACAGPAAAGSYNYGGGGYGGGEAGFLVLLEAGVAAPRNTDNVVAASGPNVIIPDWSEDLAGRIGLGYQFAGGNRLLVSFWSFETDQDATGVGAFEFPIGPTSGFGYDLTTEVKANTVDVSWTTGHALTEAFGMEWSMGLRFADFEDTTTGSYDTTGGTRAVDKSNEGTMVGARVAGRATYRLRSFSAGAAVGLSLLDGEIEAGSSLSPQPAGTSPLVLTDDSRSGSILDVELRAAWHGSRDAVSIWVGWEEQVWEDIAADLARNLPDSAVIVRDRDSVTFSWAKAGVSFRF